MFAKKKRVPLRQHKYYTSCHMGLRHWPSSCCGVLLSCCVVVSNATPTPACGQNEIKWQVLAHRNTLHTPKPFPPSPTPTSPSSRCHHATPTHLKRCHARPTSPSHPANPRLHPQSPDAFDRVRASHHPPSALRHLHFGSPDRRSAGHYCHALPRTSRFHRFGRSFRRSCCHLLCRSYTSSSCAYRHGRRARW